jgi:hypothetical protein
VLNNDFKRLIKTVELKPANKIEFIKSYQVNGDYCGKKKRMSTKKIFKTNPFDSIASILLVSFKEEEIIYKPEEDEEGIIIHKGPYEIWIPLLDGKVDMTKMFEVKTLDTELMTATADILMNFDNEDRPTEVAFCYDPRNALLFLNKKGRVIGFIEICFECLRYKVQPIDFNISAFCPEKIEILKNLFIVAGIKYGTNPFLH